MHQKQKLLELLTNHETLFDGSLGKWEGDPCHNKLCEAVKPYHTNPCGIPHPCERTLCMEVERLCKIGVLRKMNRSEWAASTFIIPKKDQTVRFISNF